MTELTEIERLANAYADARGKLAARVENLDDEIRAAKRRRLPGIKSAAAGVAAAHDELKAAIDGARRLFTRPKSQVLAGIRCGLAKQKGKLDWSDDDAVVKRIKQHLPDQVDLLIKTTEKPVKSALANLSAADLKKLGVTVTADQDEVLIKPVDSSIDKLVDALVAEAKELDEEDAA